MTRRYSVAVIFTLSILLGSYLSFTQQVRAQQHAMTFFVTSVNIGKGGDLGGLAGADAHCQTLATAVGAGGHTWHAYMSTQASGGQAVSTASPPARPRVSRTAWMALAHIAAYHETTAAAD